MRTFSLAIGVAAALIATTSAQARQAKVAVCHWDETAQTYVLIRVAVASDHIGRHAEDIAPDASGVCRLPTPPPVVDTTPQWDHVSTAASLCPAGAWGQTVTLDAPTVVSSFTFYLQTVPPMVTPWHTMSWDPITFRAQVVAWSPAEGKAVGPVLWESASTYTTTDVLSEYTFSTGNLALPAGTFVFLVNSAQLGNSDNGRAAMGSAPSYIGDPYNGGYWLDPYPGGSWVDSQCTDAVNPADYSWYVDGADLAFILTAN